MKEAQTLPGLTRGEAKSPLFLMQLNPKPALRGLQESAATIGHVQAQPRVRNKGQRHRLPRNRQRLTTSAVRLHQDVVKACLPAQLPAGNTATSGRKKQEQKMIT